MLILTRGHHQEVVIGEHGEITVSILAIEKHQVRLGFSAPHHIPINRAEIFKKIQQEKQ